MSFQHQPLNAVLANTSSQSRWTAVSSFFAQGFRRWQRVRAIRALEMLDDRLLEDIGIARNEIPRIAEGLLGMSDDSIAEGADTMRI
jgi:uncharacterized protein YjiS (DUF1127 family)